jgi:molecular chaperone GrpE
MTDFTARDTNIPDPADSDVPNTVSESAEVTGAHEAAPATTEEMSEVEALKEKYLRLAAEYDNYRKRTAKEVVQASTRGQADLIKGLLDSLDDLTRFAHLDAATTDAQTVIQGVEMVEKNVLKALSNVGLEIVDPVELPFDPNLHEAVSTAPAESPDEDHMVSQVYQRGYLLKGQLLRPARVVVKQYQ